MLQCNANQPCKFVSIETKTEKVDWVLQQELHGKMMMHSTEINLNQAFNLFYY